jgi:hypothetical protein
MQSPLSQFMAPARLCGLVAAAVIAHAAQAQSFRVAGTVFDDGDGSTLPGASLLLVNAEDTVQRRSAISDIDGNFAFASVAP